MKRSSAVLWVFLAATACGKVGAPLPPVIQIPERVENLAVSQRGEILVLTWTNPPRYVDGNAATDLGTVHVSRNGMEIRTVAAGPAGQQQSLEVDAAGLTGTTTTFSIQLRLPGRNRASAISNAALIQPLEVPGPPRNLRPLVDGFRIILDWDAPEGKSDLAETYIVQRSDGAAPSIVRTPHFEDATYERDKSYTYTVTSARRIGEGTPVPGAGNASVSVTATDRKEPAKPTGLQIESIGNVVFLRWQKNTERDLRGYRVFRSDRVDPVFTTAVDGVADPDYRTGLSYQILAEDVFGNLSPRTDPVAGP